MIFLANVNFESVASIGAILYSFAIVFVHTVSIFRRREEFAVFIYLRNKETQQTKI